MGINFGTAAMAFGSGLIKGDEKARKENLLIHGEKLKAKRDAILAMKKSKYNYDMKKYEGNKSKMDALTSVKTSWDTGKYNYKDIDGKEKLDTYKLGLAYLEAKNGLDWVAKKKIMLTEDGVTKDWVAFVTQEGNKPNLRKDLDNINFKSQNVIESNYLTAIQKIEDKYAVQLKNAKNDSPLVNAILGKKKQEIANLNIDMEQDSKDVKTIESASVITNKKADEVITDEVVTDTAEVDTSEIELGTEKVANIYSTTFKKEAKLELRDLKKYKYSDKESKDAFSSLILRTVPDKDAKSYFEKAERDGTLSAKVGIINAEKTFQTLLKHSATDLDISKLGALTNGKTGNIYNITGFPQRLDLAERHIQQYGNWFSDGEVLGEGGNWGNLLKKETNILTVPSQSVIDMNNNSLKGFNIVIPNNSQPIKANSINKYTNIKTDKPINMDVRTYVGLVYTKALHNEAIRLQKRDGGDLEVAMNKLQTRMQNDRGGNDALTKRIRKVIANSLGIVEETDKTTIKTTVTDTVAPEKTANEIEISKARKITVTHPEINNGVETSVALTEKNKKILDANNISYTVEQDTSTGDATIAQQVEQSKVKPKIKPADIGVKNMPVFETLESVQRILPNAMTAKEIKEKYEINFDIPARGLIQPSQFIE
jgi:hypothetical protein